jgi:hypothetical protein
MSLRSPISDAKGYPTREYARWLEDLYQAVGGASLTTTTVLITQATNPGVSFQYGESGHPAVALQGAGDPASSVSLFGACAPLGSVPLQ